MAATSRVTSQNQISVPAEVRRRFGIHPGTVLEWHEVEGEILIRPRRVTLDEVRAEMKHLVPRRRLSLTDLKNAKMAAIVEKHARARR